MPRIQTGMRLETVKAAKPGTPSRSKSRANLAAVPDYPDNYPEAKPGTPFARILAALARTGSAYPGSGSDFQCPVPAHDDRNPSLGVTEKANGDVLLKCLGPCKTSEVLDALGLSMADLFARDRDHVHDSNCVEVGCREWVYTDEHDNELTLVRRIDFDHDPHKQITQPRGGKARYVLYRLADVLQQVKAGGRVVLVEGEPSVDAIIEAGWEVARKGSRRRSMVATTMRGGAGKPWRDEYTETLKGASEVVIIADRDLAGYRHARLVAEQLSAAGIPVKVMLSATVRRKDDVVDHIAAGHGFTDLVRISSRELDALIEQAKRPSPGESDEDELNNASGWEPSDLRPFLDGTHSTPEPTVGHREDGAAMFYAGRVNGLYGDSEGGKSWVALFACTQRMADDESVLYIDYEDDEAGVVERLLALGMTADLIEQRFSYISPQKKFNDAARKVVQPYARAASFVVIDATTEALASENLKSNDDVDIADFYARLPRWLARFGAAVVLIDHIPKDPKGIGPAQTGSQHKRSAITGASYLVVPKRPFARGRSDGRSGLQVNKDRPGHVRAASLSVRGQDWFADFALDSSDPNAVDAVLLTPGYLNQETDRGHDDALKSKISALVADAERPLSLNEIRNRAERNKSDVASALDELVTGGFVKREPGARNAKLHTHIKPYTASKSGV